MNIQLTPEVLFAKYGQKCLEVDALRERIAELEQQLAMRDEVAPTIVTEPRQHTNGQDELPL